MLLTATQRATLDALADCLIPPDDDPGAVEAGVVEYLLRQLSGDLAPLAALYRSALDALDLEAQAAAGMPFASMPAEAQAELLRRISQGEGVTDWGVDPVAFLQIAAEHAAEGFYSDPGNGGNRGRAAWRMVGFEVTV
jgi:Gluconate 2-dehydrogenase subunit 3